MNCPACGVANREEAHFCDSCGAALVTSPSRDQRKVVSVLFCDVTGSTDLGERSDPEVVRALMARYFETAREAVERHGGQVEKFIGDAVMAVFGVPVVHENDALRAVRAALDIRAGVAVDVRIGVNTGEVVTGSGNTLVTGDAVNVAARLEQSAAPGEILIGEETHWLVRDAAQVELLPPLQAKGKSQPLTAYRVVGLTGEEGFVRRFDAPLVGRTRESRLLSEAWERVSQERVCLLLTILGAPGVGKSRLAREFLASLGPRRVASGRCLSYGEGITYWPVVEIVKQLLNGSRPIDPAISAVLGEGQASVDEIAYAVRKLLESAAAEGPLVVLLDDAQWGEPAFLDLVEHIADWSRGASILLLCLARPELLDRRPGWGGGKLNAMTVLLEPLDAAESERLLDGLPGAAVTPQLRARILAAAEGNPLFVEEMLAVLDQGGPEVEVPPTIQALLAARLDQLPALERVALERGAVEGQIFHRSAVQALGPTPEGADVAPALLGLVRKELVRPELSLLPGDDAFRFRHLLIRDAAYDALPKATRADLHERFASWLGERRADLVELDEILGYHLEQAARCRAELGTADSALAGRAAGYLGRAGVRAFERIDFHAAANLIERALALLQDDDRARVPLLATLAETLYGAGDLERAGRLLDSTIETARALGDPASATRARIFRAFVRGHSGAALAEQVKEMSKLADELEKARDEENLARALVTRGWCMYWLGDIRHALVDARRAVGLASAARSPGLEGEAAGLVATLMRWGPTPWAEVVRFVDERLASRGSSSGGRLGSSLLEHRALADAAVGKFDLARAACAEHQHSLEERGMQFFVHTLAFSTAEVELLAEEFVAAEQILRSAWEWMGAAGESGYRMSIGVMLAEALLCQGRVDDASAVIEECGAAVAPDDASAVAGIATIRGLVASRRGLHEEAVALTQEGAEASMATDYVEHAVNAQIALATALIAAGRPDDADPALRTAIALAEQKGSLVLRDRAARLLARKG